MSNEDIIKRLLGIEAWAEKLVNECRKTRRLIQAEDVSTPSKVQQGLNEEQRADIIKKRHKRNHKLRIA